MQHSAKKTMAAIEAEKRRAMRGEKRANDRREKERKRREAELRQRSELRKQVRRNSEVGRVASRGYYSNFLTRLAHDATIFSFKFAFSDGILVQATEQAIFVWGVGNEELLAHFNCHDGQVTSVAFMPVLGLIVSGSTKETLVWRWRSQTGRKSPSQ